MSEHFIIVKMTLPTFMSRLLRRINVDDEEYMREHVHITKFEFFLILRRKKNNFCEVLKSNAMIFHQLFI